MGVFVWLNSPAGPKKPFPDTFLPYVQNTTLTGVQGRGVCLLKNNLTGVASFTGPKQGSGQGGAIY